MMLPASVPAAIAALLQAHLDRFPEDREKLLNDWHRHREHLFETPADNADRLIERVLEGRSLGCAETKDR